VTLWDLATRKERHRLPDALRAEVRACFSGDSRLMAASPPEGPVRVWDVATGKEVRQIPLWPCKVMHLALSPDGRTLALRASDGTVGLWDVATGETLPVSAEPLLAVSELRFTRGGSRLVGRAERWLAWDAVTGRLTRRYPRVRDTSRVSRLSPDESLLAVSDKRGGTITLDDAATGRTLRTLAGHARPVWVLRFSADGRRLFSAGADKSVCVWDVAAGRLLHRLTGHLDPVGRMAVSPDGRRLATATYDPFFEDFANRLWDVEAGRLLRQFTPRRGSAHDLAFSPDGRLLASVGGRTGLPNKRGDVQVWDIATGHERGTFEGHTERAACAAFSPDGRSLATGGVDRTVRLWELATGSERACYRGHEGEVHSVAFSPDGRRLAAASAEAPVYVWDVTGWQGPKPSPAGLARAWGDLLGDDATAAFRAIRQLSANPEQALPFLRERLKPVAAVDPARLRQLLSDLDGPTFAERERATAAIERLADRAEGSLRRALTETASPELRRRLGRIVARLDTLTPERLRATRAVEALEGMRTSGAAKLLDELAAGAAGARLTRESMAARQRLSTR
jgi:WD40 repeat protein